MLLSTELQPCLHVRSPSACRSPERAGALYCEDSVLSRKAEPDPFSSPLPVPLGEEGGAVLASLGSGWLCNPLQAPGEGQPAHVLCGLWRRWQGKRPSPRIPFLWSGVKGEEDACWLLLRSFWAQLLLPGPLACQRPLSPHSAYASFVLHSYSLQTISSPNNSDDPWLPTHAFLLSSGCIASISRSARSRGVGLQALRDTPRL